MMHPRKVIVIEKKKKKRKFDKRILTTIIYVKMYQSKMII